MSFTQTACRLSPSETGIRLNETALSTLLPGEDVIEAFVSAFVLLKLIGISVSSAVSSLISTSPGCSKVISTTPVPLVLTPSHLSVIIEDFSIICDITEIILVVDCFLN